MAPVVVLAARPTALTPGLEATDVDDSGPRCAHAPEIPAAPGALEAPEKTREMASSGHHQALAAHWSVRPGWQLAPGIAEAVERQTKAMREFSHRAFPEPDVVADDAPALPRAVRAQHRRQAAATEAAALRRARQERAARASGRELPVSEPLPILYMHPGGGIGCAQGPPFSAARQRAQPACRATSPGNTGVWLRRPEQSQTQLRTKRWPGRTTPDCPGQPPSIAPLPGHQAALRLVISICRRGIAGPPQSPNLIT